MTLNPDKFKSPLDEAQLFVFETIVKQRDILHKNDCSNQSYQLAFWWSALGHKPRIYICRLWGYQHAQVELPNKGYYDPIQNDKKEMKLLSRWKPADKAKKLPAGAKFEYYLDESNIKGSGEWIMSQNQYNTMLMRLRVRNWSFNTSNFPLNIKEWYDD